MDAAEYRELVARLRGEDDVRREVLARPGLRYEAARAIWTQHFQVLTKRAARELGARAAALHARWAAGERTLLELSREVPLGEGQHYSACLVAKALLKLEPGLGARDVSAIAARPEGAACPRVAREMAECVAADPHYSPLAERARRVAGLEYEYVLQQRMRALGVAFLDEDDLKRRGYAKTPDVMLLSPLRVGGGGGGADGGADGGGDEAPFVHWIDSKAMFGDPSVWATHRAQLSGYVNRYGPGMVVYWFGHVRGLAPLDGVTLAADFPAAAGVATVASVLEREAAEAAEAAEARRRARDGDGGDNGGGGGGDDDEDDA